MKYSIIFVLFVTLFLVACTSTQSSLINATLDTPGLVGDIKAPNFSDPQKSDGDIDDSQRSSDIELVFVNNLQLLSFELQHSGFDDSFFSKNSLLINKLDFVLYNDIKNEDQTSNLTLLNNCKFISNNSKICSNFFVTEMIDIFIQNYNDCIRLSVNLEIKSECSLPSLALKDTLVLGLEKIDDNNYSALINVPYKLNDVLLGNFTLTFVFAII